MEDETEIQNYNNY